MASLHPISWQKALLTIALTGIVFSSWGAYQYRTYENLYSSYRLNLNTEEQSTLGSLYQEFSAAISQNGKRAMGLIQTFASRPSTKTSHVLAFFHAKALSSTSQYTEAKQILDTLLTGNYGAPSFRGDVLVLQGRVQKILGEYEASIESYRKALALYTNTEDILGQALVQINIGEYYRALSTYERALDHLALAQQLFDSNRQLPGDLYQYYLNRLAAVYNENGQLAKAEKTTRETIRLAESSDNLDLLAGSCNELASILHKTKGPAEEVEFYLQKAISIWQESGNTRYQVSATGNLVSFWIENGKWSEVPATIEQVLPAIKENNWDAVLYTFYFNLSLYNTYLGNTSEAIAYFDSARNTQLRDMQRFINEELAVQTAQFELERQQLLLEKVEAQSQSAKQEKYAAYTILGVAVLLLLLIGGFAYFVQLKKREIEGINLELEKASVLKDALLADLNHRVKNNLQVISSILEMQMDSTDNRAARDVLAGTQRKVRTMAILHQKLYETDELTGVLLEDYLLELTTEIRSSFGELVGDVQFVIDSNVNKLTSNQSIPLGLIVNELVTNSLKHAFEAGKKGKITIKANRKDETIQLTIADTGKGYPPGILKGYNNSLGLRIISILIRQLKGEFQLKNNNGASFTLSIPTGS